MLFGRFWRVACLPIFCLFWMSAAQAQEDAAAKPAATGPLGDFMADRLGFMNTETPWKTWVIVPLITRHFNREAVIDDNLSEDNPGLGVERSNGEWRLMAGVYRNSIRQDTVYGLVGYTPWRIGLPSQSNLSLGAAAGLLTGYQNTQKGYPIIPAGGVLLAWDTPYHFGLNLFLVPTLASFQVQGFAAAQLKLSF